VYYQVSGKGFCLLLNEMQGERGANEIGSVLYIYLKEYMKNAKHVIIRWTVLLVKIVIST